MKKLPNLPPLPPHETIEFSLPNDKHQETCPRCGAPGSLHYRGMRALTTDTITLAFQWNCSNQLCHHPHYCTEIYDQEITYKLEFISNKVSFSREKKQE